jgi:alkanesulfonate monooxygenase SsuD/methylene tetrahydromethanopterin reductase-like flavin-dependent oxidoreductase (luciferase family)
LIESTCLVGTADQLIERLRALSATGLRQVMILPSFEPRYSVLERVAKDVLPFV